MSKTSHFIDLEERHCAHTYKPVPVVIESAKGVHVFDVDGKKYIDCLASYSAVNQGHCHPTIIAAVKEQLDKVTLTSRAFHSNMLGVYAKYITELFGYDKMIPMNTGVEAGETACKLARRWGYEKKKIPENQAVILFAEGGFWGRTMSAISASTDPDCYRGFGPYMPGFGIIPFNNIDALREKLESNPNICAFYVEPIQGEAGVVVPDDGYLKAVREVCNKHNVLWIADEIQTGLGRTGYKLACEHENVKPDLALLGKALSAGMMPVSVVLGMEEVMECIRHNEHGSTYGGNPLACHVAQVSLRVLLDEKMCENATEMGNLWRREMNEIKATVPWLVEVRGRGLMNAAVFDPNCGVTALEVCMRLKEKGILAKPTHGNIVRFTPPLVITKEQVHEAIGVVREALEELNAKVGKK